MRLRPLLSQWRDDELMTLVEAAALHFPAGPLSAVALRGAFGRGELAATMINGKLFTTSRDVLDLMRTQIAAPGGRDRPDAAASFDEDASSGPTE